LKKNLEKKVNPSLKALMGFISFGGGYIFVWVRGLKPPKPMQGYVAGAAAVNKHFLSQCYRQD